MGSNYSKSNVGTDAVAQKNDLDKDISTNPDPRSPTPEIARTPLQVCIYIHVFELVHAINHAFVFKMLGQNVGEVIFIKK